MSDGTTTITGSLFTGITLTSPQYADPVTVAVGAYRYSAGGSAIYADSVWTVVNEGTLFGNAGRGTGVYLKQGGAITNATGGYISGHYGVQSFSDTNVLTVSNAASATIYGGAYGVFAYSGLQLTNQGTINSEDKAVYGFKGLQTIANQGLITGANTGLVTTGGSISNQGTILGGSGEAIESTGTETIVNQGTIKATGGKAGINVTNNATIINSGLIAGVSNSFTGYTAIATSKSLQLEIEQGSTIHGTVSTGDGGILELGSVSGTGTLSGVGSSFVGFSTIEIDAGATWSLSGNAAGFTGTFGGSKAEIVGFTNADSIDLTGVTFSAGETAAFANGTLSFANTNGSYAIDFESLASNTDFTLSDDGNGGTEIKIGSATSSGITTITGSLFTGITLTSPQYADPVTVAVGAYRYAPGGNAIYAATPWTVVNEGTLIGDTGHSGIYLTQGGAVTNAAGGYISGHYGILSAPDTDGLAVSNAASATIYGTVYGIYADNLQLTNQGTISSAERAVDAGHGLQTIMNQGLITGANVGLQLTGGFMSNQGTILGGEGAAIYSTGTETIANQGTIKSTGGEEGIAIQNNATIINSGLIAGVNTGFGAYTAISTSKNLLLEIEQGSTIQGAVFAGDGGILELGSVSGTGTLSGVGSSFVGFSTIEIDAGATWSLSGNAAGFTGTFGGSKAEIVGFTNADSIDLTGVTFSAGETAAFANGTLSFANTNGSYAIDFESLASNTDFTLSDDGNGGTEIKIGSATSSVITTITGSLSTGVTLTSPEYADPVTVAVGTYIYAKGGSAIYAATPWTVVNEGTLRSDTNGLDSAVYLAAGGTVTNAVGGSIGGNYGIVSINDTDGLSVTNAASATINTGGFGIFTGNGLDMANQGAISSETDGVYSAGIQTITNLGLITGAGKGVDANDGGTIFNQGTILGGSVAAIYGFGNEIVMNKGPSSRQAVVE